LLGTSHGERKECLNFEREDDVWEETLPAGG
jgi:hypothetical protein